MHDTAVLSPSMNVTGSETYRLSILWTLMASRTLVLRLHRFLLPVSIIGYLILEGIHCVSWRFLVDYPKGLHWNQGGIWPAVEGSLALASIGFSWLFPWPLEERSISLNTGVHNDSIRSFAFSSSVLRRCRPFCTDSSDMPSSSSSSGSAFPSSPAPWSSPHHVSHPLDRRAGIAPVVDDAYREMGLSLGVTRIYLIRRVLLRKAWRGIVAGVVLAVGHAVGSAAPVLFTASIYFRGGAEARSPRDDVAHSPLPSGSEAISFDQAFGTALVLIAGLLIFNASAMLLRRLGGGFAQ